MTDLEKLEAIMAKIRDPNFEPSPAQMVGADPEGLEAFIHKMTNQFLTTQQANNFGLPMMNEESLANFFLIGMVVGAEYSKERQ